MPRAKLSTISIAALQGEIERRMQSAPKLIARRDELTAAIGRIDAELSSLGIAVDGVAAAPAAPGPRRGRGRPPGSKNKKKRGRPAGAKQGPGRPPGSKNKVSRGPGRPKGSGRGPRANNKMTLFDALTGLLKGNPMSVSDMPDAVKKAGYKTKASSFRTIINQTLIKHPKHFKKVERGVYVVE